MSFSKFATIYGNEIIVVEFNADGSWEVFAGEIGSELYSRGMSLAGLPPRYEFVFDFISEVRDGS